MNKDKPSINGVRDSLQDCQVKTIINENEFLRVGLISEQLVYGKITHINKAQTGNGATFSWLEETPPTTKTNIIIEPNVSTIQSKEKEYLENPKPHNTRCFIYEGNPIDYSRQYNHLVMTTDSFVHNHKQIFKEFNIHSILVDEFHTVVQASDYRRVMSRMMDVLKSKCDTVYIGTVTATPMLHAHIDVEIVNELQEPRFIVKSFNLESTINNICEKVKTGEHTMVFLNDAKLAHKIMHSCGRSDIQLKCGESFKNTLYKRGKVTVNEISNLHIISSAGYEGFDYQGKANVFTFTCYSNRYTSMLTSNIIQCNGRPRKGVLYSEHCEYTTEHFDSNSINDLKNKVEFLVNSKTLNREKQRTNYRFRYKGEQLSASTFNPFVIFGKDKETITLKPNYMAIEKEYEIRDTKFKSEKIPPYLKSRKIEMISNGKDVDNEFKTSKAVQMVTIDNLISNFKNNGYDKKELHSALYSTRLIYLTSLEDFNKEFTIAKEVKEGLGEPYKNETLALNLINSDTFKRDVVDLYSKKKKELSKEEVLDAAYKLVYEIIGKRKSAKYRGHRNYNTLTMLSNRIIKYIASCLDKALVEIDIKQAYPTLVYKLNGFDKAPDDIYGEDREKGKTDLNTAFNMLHSTIGEYKRKRTARGLSNTKKDVKTQQAREVRNKKKMLSKFNLDPRVVDYLINTYTIGNEDKGKFHNDMSYHESLIINSLCESIEYYNEGKDYFMATKHDAVQLFFDKSESIEIKNSSKIIYQGKNDWFGCEILA